MSFPLHYFLLDLAQGDLTLLREADIAVDNAQLAEQRDVRRIRNRPSFSPSSSSSNFVPLHSLPSLATGGSRTRWDPAVEKLDSPYMSPPRRPKRFSLDTILAESNKIADKSFYGMTQSQSASNLCKKYGSPKLPKRRSLVSLPILDHESSVPAASVRADLHVILGNALDQCADLDDYYEDASVLSSDSSADCEQSVTAQDVDRDTALTL
jgi:hypothetical protein